MEAKLNLNAVLKGDELLKHYQLRCTLLPQIQKLISALVPIQTPQNLSLLKPRSPIHVYSTLQASIPFLLYWFDFPLFETFHHVLFSIDLET